LRVGASVFRIPDTTHAVKAATAHEFGHAAEGDPELIARVESVPDLGYVRPDEVIDDTLVRRGGWSRAGSTAAVSADDRGV
jgi:hypothetical protein